MSAADPTQRTGRIVITDDDLAPQPPLAGATAAPVATVVAPAAPAPIAQAPAVAPPAAPPPPIAPAMPASGGPGRRIPRWAIITPSILAAILLAVVTFFLGQGTRSSSAEVAQQLSVQKADLLAQRKSALRQQARDLRRTFNESLERQLKAAKDQAHQAGVAQGEANAPAPAFNDNACYSPITERYVC